MHLSTAYKERLSKAARVLAALAVVATSVGSATAAPANAALTTLTNTINDSRPAQAGVTHTIVFRPSASLLTAIARVDVKFCTTSASFGGCIAPTGLDITAGMAGAAAANFSGAVAPTAGSFNRTAANVFNFQPTVPATEVSTHDHTLTLTGLVTNPTSAGSYYVMIETYSDTGATAVIDAGATAFAIVTKVDVTGRVSESLTFTVNGVNSGVTCGGENASVTSSATGIPFGNFTSGSPLVACQTVAVATNAVTGYTASVRHTLSGASPLGGMCRQTATDCTADGGTASITTANTIVDAGLDGTPGTYAGGDYGVGLNANGGQAPVAFGGNANYVSMFNASRAIAFNAGPTNAVNTTVKLKADVPATQTAGVYQNSFEYLVVPIF